MPSVLQPWLERIPIRMQSTLLLSLRGPDTHVCAEVKKVQRWMRGVTFKPGNPDNFAEFMTHAKDVPVFAEKGPLARELEFCTQHFYSHLLHGLEVIAYRHPRSEEHSVSFNLFCSMCEAYHLSIETRAQFESRLGEREWPGGKQPEDFREAASMLDVEF